MSKFGMPSFLREAAHEMVNAVTHPALLAVLAATHSGCARFDDAEDIDEMACASKMLDQEDDLEDSWPSTRIALSENGNVGYAHDGDGRECIVKSYTAWDPGSLEDLDAKDIGKLLEHNLVPLTFEASSTLEAEFDSERLGKSYLGDSAEDFGLGSREHIEGNFYAAVCADWAGPSAFAVTDLCKDVVLSNGDAWDVYPALPSE